MFKKLFIYDLKRIYKTPLGTFYIVILLSIILTRIFALGDSGFMQALYNLFRSLSIGLAFGVAINNCANLWGRFNQSIYGDESYLTHTLPIKKKTLYGVKFCVALVSLLATLIVIGISITANYYTPELITMFNSATGSIWQTIWFFALLTGVLYLELVFITQVGMTGILLGHQHNTHRALIGFIWAVIIYLICNGLIIALAFLLATINPDLMAVFSANSIISLTSAKTLLHGTIACYLIFIVINFLTNQRLLARGVNVD